MMKDCRVAWCIPPLNEGSGGLNTIFRNAEALCAAGCVCDFYIPANISTAVTKDELKRQITEWYRFSSSFRVFPCATRLEGPYDLAIATLWSTASFVEISDAKKKAYFVQDWEPSFYPVGEEYLSALSTYLLELNKITIGKWLALKCSGSDGLPAACTIFGADKSLYRPLEGFTKERAICAIYQPEKPRRSSKLLIEALKIFKETHPDITVYLYGSSAPSPDRDFIQLGLLSREKCNELYNVSLCGVSMSTTNPSRIPFEMMAAGLPVVDLYGENTIYDFPNGACLAMQDAASLATAIGRLVDEESLRRGVSEAGLAYMQDKGIEREQFEFVEACDEIVGGMTVSRGSFRPKHIDPVSAGQHEREAYLRLRRETLSSAADRIIPAPLSSGSVKINLSMDGSMYREVKIAIWSSPDQGDLIWVPLDRDDSRGTECWQSSPCALGIGRDPRMYQFHIYAAQDNKSGDLFISAFAKVLVLEEGCFAASDNKVSLSGNNGIRLELQACLPDCACDESKTLTAELASDNGFKSIWRRIALKAKRG